MAAIVAISTAPAGIFWTNAHLLEKKLTMQLERGGEVSKIFPGPFDPQGHADLPTLWPSAGHQLTLQDHRHGSKYGMSHGVSVYPHPIYAGDKVYCVVTETICACYLLRVELTLHNRAPSLSNP